MDLTFITDFNSIIFNVLELILKQVWMVHILTFYDDTKFLSKTQKKFIISMLFFDISVFYVWFYNSLFIILFVDDNNEDSDWFCWQCECIDDCLDLVNEQCETEVWLWTDLFPEISNISKKNLFVDGMLSLPAILYWSVFYYFIINYYFIIIFINLFILFYFFRTMFISFFLFLPD